MPRMIQFLLFLFMGWIQTIRCEQMNEPTYPEIGKSCPDFILHNIRYYKQKQASLNDFLGKWLILDFWNSHCGACVASFPKVSAIQKKFMNEVQFMMVGIQDPEGQIESIFARFRKEENLVMPCGFDSLLAQRFDIYTAPYIIVVDPVGCVRAITYSLDAEDVRGFLEDRPPRLDKAYRMHEDRESKTVFNNMRPLLINGNGGPDSVFLFRSILSAWDGFTQPGYIPATIDEDSAIGMFQVMGVPLIRLFHFAYSGKSWPGNDYAIEPVLEVRNSGPFQWSTVHSSNLFCYSLQIPANKVTRISLQHKLQRDLEDYFGYTASIELRPVPCWRLTTTSEAKRRLASRGGREIFRTIIPKADFEAKNWPFSQLVQLLQGHCKEKILDESGITGNIDIKIESALSDIHVIKAVLQPLGINLEPTQKTHKVLVIRDKP